MQSYENRKKNTRSVQILVAGRKESLVSILYFDRLLKCLIYNTMEDLLNSASLVWKDATCRLVRYKLAELAEVNIRDLVNARN